MQTLAKQIIEEQQKIDEELAKTNPTLDFYREFFGKYPNSRVSDILEMDTCDLIVALIAKEQTAQPIESIKDAVYSNRNFFENVTPDDINKILEIVLKADQSRILTPVIERLNDGVRTSRLGKLLSEECRFTEELAQIAEKFETTPKNFVKIVNHIIDDINICFGKNPEEPIREFSLMEAVTYVDALKEFRKDQANHQEFIEDFLGMNLKGKGLSRAMKNLAQIDGWDLDGIIEEVAHVRRVYDDMNNQEFNRTRNLNRTKNAYETLLGQMFRETSNKEREIKVPAKALSKLPSEVVKNSALRVIYGHNLALCEQKETEYLEVAANATTSYQLLLANYGISPSQYEVGTVLHQTLKDIESMLKELTAINITDPTLLLSIIQLSDLDTIKNYTTLAEKGIITSNLLTNHPSLFNIRSKEYENMMRNLATIKQHSINPHYFTETEEVLVTPHKNFSHSIETLETYQLTQSMRTGMDTTFLQAPDLASAIDTLLELGYEENLESSPDLLNYRDKFERLRVLKELNIPLSSTEELLAVLTTDKFYVPDCMIKDYIYNAVDYNLPEGITFLDIPKKKSADMAKLEEFSATQRTYNFNGVTISKNRVIRNLNNVKSNGNVDDRLVYSILQGTTLNDEEVAKIKSTLGASKSNAPTKQKS